MNFPHHDPAWLERMYNNRALVPDHLDYLQRWADASALALGVLPDQLEQLRAAVQLVQALLTDDREAEAVHVGLLAREVAHGGLQALGRAQLVEEHGERKGLERLHRRGLIRLARRGSFPLHVASQAAARVSPAAWRARRSPRCRRPWAACRS